MNRETKRYTEAQWAEEGKRLFGTEDRTLWRFRCPVCGHVQSAKTMQEHKDRGATPSSAYQECAGRFTGGKTDFGSEGRGPGCDYAAYGFIRVGDFVDGTPVFPFDEEPQVEEVADAGST